MNMNHVHLKKYFVPEGVSICYRVDYSAFSRRVLNARRAFASTPSPPAFAYALPR
jgi:hypothetical protein